jgi:hypothetical protein
MSRATALGALKENDNRKKAPLADLDGTSETDLKQCADKYLGTKFRKRRNPLYLAIHGRSSGAQGQLRSTLFCDFSKQAPLPISQLRLLAAFAISMVATCILHAGSMRSFAGCGRRMLFIRFIDRACPSNPAPSSEWTEASARERAAIPRFAAPLGRSPRAPLLLFFNTLGATPASILRRRRVGFSRDRCVTFVRKPTLKSVR